MIAIRNFFLNLSAVLCVIILLLYLLILAVGKGYLDTPIRKVIESYLEYKNIKVKIGNLSVRNNILSIDKIVMDFTNNAKGEITNFKISFVISSLMDNPLITNTISTDNFVINSEDNQPIVESKISAKQTIELYQNNIVAEIHLAPIKNITLRDSYGKNLPDGEGTCFYKGRILGISKKTIECELNFSERANLLLKSTIDNNLIDTHVSVNNIPIMIYKIAEKFLGPNNVLPFLDQHIKGGYIRKGELDFNLDSNSLANVIPETAIKGKLHVTDLEYKYDKDFPPLQKIDTDITIKGPKVKFILNNAYSNNSALSGLVTFEWKGIEDSSFYFRANAKGQVGDLINFISHENYQKTKKQGIDLKKITGQAESKIEIIIPLRSDIKNTYNISTVITNANLAAFNNNIILKNAKISGLFDGDKLTLSGVGKINNNNSNFVYKHNITENKKDGYENILNVKTNFSVDQQQIGLVKLIAGNAIVDFEYKKQHNGEPLITVSSNLTNLEFYIDKISIHKKRMIGAKLIFSGKLTDNLNSNINFSLTGEDNLKITGKLKVQNSKYAVDLAAIQYGETDLRGKLLLDNDNINAEIYGKQLDLSNSNMMQFLKKNADSKNTHFKVDVAKIRLKNNIWLDDFNLHINCNKVKCFSGSLLSKINTKVFKMLLTATPEGEQWIITCNNAGDLLKGLNMYNKMKNGAINLVLDTKRQEVKKGEIIPILDGTFNIKHFTVTDMSFLTRIVSFVSFPGFMSFILNNKNITFTNMDGKFNYIGNTIRITNSSAKGPFFDFTMQGVIDTNKHRIKLKGNVIPSFFFVSSIVTKIPIIGKIFSNVAPYSVELEYKE